MVGGGRRAGVGAQQVEAMNARKYVRNFDAEQEARRIRETFMDRPATKKTLESWAWPEKMQEAGVCDAVMYSSDKWRKPGDFVDYKHRAEATQRLYVAENFLGDLQGRPLKTYGTTVSVSGMPTVIAHLAKILGIQCRLFDSRKRLGDPYQVDIGRGELGAATHPETGERFLVIYTKANGPLCIISGDELDIEKDGIVG